MAWLGSNRRLLVTVAWWHVLSGLLTSQEKADT